MCPSHYSNCIFTSPTVLMLLCHHLDSSPTIAPFFILNGIFQHFLSQGHPYLHVFAYLYSTVNSMMYICFKLSKRPRFILRPAGQKYLKWFLLDYGHKYTVYLLSYMLHLQWLMYHILLSADVDKRPGPDQATFKCCSWNLNSLCAYDFIRVFLVEAYNSIYNYDLIGLMETHLDSTINDSKLTRNGYSFLTSSHPKNVKQGGIALYVRLLPG